ncbi:MAG: hypothetical protein AAGA42_06055 [Actinomycetota bacterium]
MTDAEATLLAIHLAATAGMMGVIWFVQLVQYPLFAAVGEDGFAAYEAMHQRRTSMVVGPLMAVEGVAALVIIVWLRDLVGLTLPLVGLVLLGVIHASTTFVQVPAHMRLADGFDAATHRRLVHSNWVRTAGWTLRTVLAGAMIVVAA